MLILLSIISVAFLYLHSSSTEEFCDGYKSLDYFEYPSPNFNIDTDITILIVAGTHGNEPAGHFALKEMINKLETGSMSVKNGRLILVPSVNFCALKENARMTSKTGDINRQYPHDNNVDSVSTNEINNAVMKLVKESNFIIDIHEGWGYNRKNNGSMGSTLSPSDTQLSYQLAFDIVTEMNKNINEEHKKFGILTGKKELIAENPYMYNKHEDIKGSLSYYCDNLKKDYILIETTGQKDIQPLEVRVGQNNFVIEYILGFHGMI